MIGSPGVHSSSVDLPTLSLAAMGLSALLGLFLWCAWLHQRDERALAWWGSAYLIGAVAIAQSAGHMPLGPFPDSLPQALAFVACGVIWNGVRLFHGRRLLPAGAMAGAIVWLLACRFFAGDWSDESRVRLGVVIVAAYTFCVARELWRERRKNAYSRAAAVIVPCLHATVLLLPLLLQSFWPVAFTDGWIAIFTFETIIYAVGAAFIVLLLVKDHHLRIYRTAAFTDHLTGLLNRRAFLDGALSLCAAQAGRREPVTLLMFDLDHFKSINDRFGHAVGDDVLRVFAQVIRTSMRATDIVGRLGGEEFAAIVPGDIDVGAKIAERIRSGFEVAGAMIGMHAVRGTVSIGSATAHAPVTDVDALIARADAALYEAKRGGRNRFQPAAEEAAPEVAAAPPAPRPKGFWLKGRPRKPVPAVTG
ncbi:MAG TPA: GGDEF domain-containing protein [Xanthobacteraceae bacterium]|nr:GGDEF domain-containing protein [Xanthobacteraceae bacterium]